MQILLTEDEYNELKNKADRSIEYSDLQLLCTLAANHVPVQRNWDKDNVSPWGCILDDVTNPEYCDDCPAEEICPYGHKQFSQ